MSPRDHDAERRRASIEAQRLVEQRLVEQAEGRIPPDEPDPISTPGDRRGNVKRWWTETWGKAVGTVLGAVLLAAIWWTWGVARAFHAATLEVYAQPPIVAAHGERLKALEAKPPIPPAQVKALAEELAKAMATTQAKK